MKITAINQQVRDKNRVNVSVDGVFRFSLDIAQVVDLGIKVGLEFDEDEIDRLKSESDFGKIYSRSLEYALMRPRSKNEVNDYLYKKTLTKIDKSGKKVPGISYELKDRVINRLVEKGYIDDEKFAIFWVENRFVKKGVSSRRLASELSKKGISSEIINRVLGSNNRNDRQEILKVVNKKRNKYDDQQMMAYLARQGFKYEDIKSVLSGNDDY